VVHHAALHPLEIEPVPASRHGDPEEDTDEVCGREHAPNAQDVGNAIPDTIRESDRVLERVLGFLDGIGLAGRLFRRRTPPP
jgi:hypothetical protein